MKVEIVSTGDELITGSISDTNASYLNSKFAEIGAQVRRCSIVGDNEKELSALLNEVSHRSDIVVVTGGLGPTQDDITASVAAIVFQDKLVENVEALAEIESFFKKKNLHMSDSNKKQAFLPSKAQILQNRCGTAPGFSIKYDKALFFFLPGVPSEMEGMFIKKVLPVIYKKFKIKQRHASKIILFGVPESKAAQDLKGFQKKFPTVQLGFRAAFPIIEVKLSISVETDSVRIEKNLKEAHKWVVSNFNPSQIVSDKGLSMEEEIGRLLTEKKKTVAIAESCTGGLISNMLTDVSGSSAYFLFSAVTYSNDTKMNILNVNLQTIIDHGAVHQNTAKEMAEGVREKAGADFGISTSGVAGPTGGTKEKPVGTICIGFAKKGFSTSRTYCLDFNDRTKNKMMFAHACLNFLRKELL